MPLALFCGIITLVNNMQINRLLEIVYLLLEQKTVTAKTLSKKFGVSQRTIYRDIDALSLADIPVYAEKGKGGGISLLPEFVLSKSILNEQEQQEILSALQVFSGVDSAKTGQALKKLSALFKKSAADWLQVDFSDWNFSSNNFFNDFRTAILERRIAEFDYYGTSGEKTRRRIEPVQLWFKYKAWYIKGFCLTRQNMRIFKLSRIKNLKITNKVFSVRDISTTKPDIWPENNKKQKLVTMKFKIDPEMTYRVFDEFDENMIEKQSDGSFIVSVTWPQDYWMFGSILSFGEHIEVLEPKYMRKTMKNKISKIGKKYL